MKRQYINSGASSEETQTVEYRTYHSAKNRCECETSNIYKYYGARGIEFNFKDYNEFLNEVGRRPSDKHSLDRIDNNGHYEVGNVRWTIHSEQMKNRRKCKQPTVSVRNKIQKSKTWIITTPNGDNIEVFNLKQWCEDNGLGYTSLYNSLNTKKKTYKGYSIKHKG